MHSKGRSFRLPSRGFSLLEVLVAAVVLATGLLALAALQAALARNSADARARSQVASFAELIMERQRSEGSGSGYADVPYNDVWTADELADVEASAGVSNLAVNVTSTLYDGRDGTFDAYAGTDLATDDPQYKEVLIEATWTDATGGTRRFEMPSILSPRSITDSTAVFDLPTNTGTATSPIVRTDTPSEAGIIPIAIGDNTDTAATNPRPEIAGKNNNQSVVGTSYEVLTYRNEDSTTVRTQRRVETKVIDCTCSPSAAPTGDFFSTAQWPAYWTGERYNVFVPSNGAAAPGSTRSAGPATGVTQDELCTDCCRDHHDNVTTEDDSEDNCEAYDTCEEDLVEFDPYRTDNHQHYKLQGGTLVAAGNSDNYLESCRMIRVDGFWRTASDLNLDHLGLIETVNSARSAEPSTTAVENYEDFVIEFLESNYLEGETPVAAETVFDTEGLNAPAQIAIGRPTPIDTRYLHARGLYVDYLERKARQKIEEAFEDCPTSTTNKVECILPFLPFTTINTTELAFWAPSNDAVLTVSSASSLVFDPELPTRGRVNALSGAPSGNPIADAVSSIGKSNTGVAIASPIDTEDAVLATDEQEFQVSAGSTGSGESFSAVLSGLPQLTDANTSNDPALAWYVGSDSGNCLATITNNQDKDPNPYACATTSPLNTAATVRVQSYNGQVDRAEDISVTCTAGGATVTETWDTARYCQNYQVASATIGGVAGSPGVAVNDGMVKAEYTDISFATIAPGAQAAITFSFQGESRVTTFTCTLNGGGNKISTVVWSNCP